eukprot:6574958-Alexandrium_andersonii.AAC.1
MARSRAAGRCGDATRILPCPVVESGRLTLAIGECLLGGLRRSVVARHRLCGWRGGTRLGWCRLSFTDRPEPRSSTAVTRDPSLA